MSEQRRWILVIVLGAASITAVAACLFDADSMQVANIAYAGVGYLVVSAVPIRLPRGDTLGVGIGPALAAAVLLSPCEAVTGLALGVVAAAALGVRDNSPSGLLMDSLRYPLIIFVVARLMVPELELGAVEPLGLEHVLGLLALTVSVLALDLLTYAAFTAWIDAEPLLQRTGSFLRLVGGVYAGQASVGVALAIVYPSMGPLGALVLLVLMLVMKHTFGLYLRIRSAYERTVGVLARLAEFQLSETQGHAERVASIATSMGRQLRLRHRSLERLALAALLHDIGKVGAEAVTEIGVHATLGARILSQVPFLEDVAPVVARHHDESFGHRDPDGLLAQIVSLASRYDEVRHLHKGSDADSIALEAVLEYAASYDDRVVAALRRAVRRPA